jgi:hypothetical protein
MLACWGGLLVLLAEFGGKGDRELSSVDGSRQKAVSRKQESGSNKLIADCGAGRHEDAEMG